MEILVTKFESVVFSFIRETPTGVYCPAQRSSCYVDGGNQLLLF